MTRPAVPALPPFVTASADGVRVAVRLTPRASRNAVAGLAPAADGSVALKVEVTAPPEDGKANAALTRLLAGEWGVARSTIAVAVGATSRTKTLAVRGDPADLAERLARWASGRLKA